MKGSGRKRTKISREDVPTFTMNGIIRFTPVGAAISYPLSSLGFSVLTLN